MKSLRQRLFVLLMAGSAMIMAQNASGSQSLNPIAAPSNARESAGHAAAVSSAGDGNPGPFTYFALGGGISPLGIDMMAVTNLNRQINLRLNGSTFKYSINNISTNGFDINGSLNLASMGVSADLYPFPNHGLRFSPGLLLYNGNQATASFAVQGGQSFTLNNTTYYSSPASPVTGSGALGLNSQKPAFTLTAGWGNSLRRGGHISFPFEIGAAFVGTPSLNILLNSGQVCNFQGGSCVNVATDSALQSDLQQQIAKYKSDLSPLKTYPIVSFGVAYSFRVR